MGRISIRSGWGLHVEKLALCGIDSPDSGFDALKSAVDPAFHGCDVRQSHIAAARIGADAGKSGIEVVRRGIDAGSGGTGIEKSGDEIARTGCDVPTPIMVFPRAGPGRTGSEPIAGASEMNELDAVVELSETDFVDIGKALEMLERQVAALAVLLEDRTGFGLLCLGDETENFSRAVLNALAKHPDLIESEPGLARARTELETASRLRVPFERLRKLAEQADQVENALGGEVYDAAMSAYFVLKEAGRAGELEPLLKSTKPDLSRRGRLMAHAQEPASKTRH